MWQIAKFCRKAKFYVAKGSIDHRIGYEARREDERDGRDEADDRDQRSEVRGRKSECEFRNADLVRV
jgi:hypothetical protein